MLVMGPSRSLGVSVPAGRMRSGVVVIAAAGQGRPAPAVAGRIGMIRGEAEACGEVGQVVLGVTFANRGIAFRDGGCRHASRADRLRQDRGEDGDQS